MYHPLLELISSFLDEYITNWSPYC